MVDTRPYAIIGAGGHAAVVAELIHALGGTVAGFIDRASGDGPFGMPILGDDSWLEGRAEAYVLANGIGGTGDNRLRAKLYANAKALGYTFPPLVHPSSSVSHSVAVAEGAQVMRGALVNARARIGENVVVNTGALIEHDCVLETHAYVAPGACLSGGCTIGELAHVGTGATLIQGIAIGTRAIVAAGAVVIADVAAETTVMGVPARSKDR